MSADVHHLPPRCRACQRPMELIHVLSDSKYVDAPVRTYRCSTCGTGLIRKTQPAATDEPAVGKCVRPATSGTDGVESRMGVAAWGRFRRAAQAQFQWLFRGL
jgi:hypothetical protein